MGTTMRAMQYGQHAITAVLIVIGIIRALGNGSSLGLTAGGVLVFILWYLWGALHGAKSRDRAFGAIWLIGLGVIWALLTVISLEFIWLAFPLWLLAGHLLRRWASVLFSLGVLAVVVAGPIIRSGSIDYAYIVGPVVGGLFAFGISRGYLQLVADARERQQLIASLVQAQDDMAGLHDELGRTQRESGMIEERTRLSRDIHDTIAQGLSAIVLITRSNKGPSGPDAEAALAQIETIAVDSLVDVRRIVDALAPAELQEGTLTLALRRMLDRLSEETGIRTELHADAPLPRLSVAGDVALLRTAQSALSNVRIHAHAQRVVVSLVDAGDSIRLDIVDDGHGFDLDAWRSPKDDVITGFGLHAMRSRLRELGGGLDIETAENEGTALSAQVPLGPAARREEAG